MMTLGSDDLGVDGEDFSDELAPGTKLMLGQYTIKEFLAAGGFGITYLANDSLGRNLVIKECFPGNFCRRQNHSVLPRSRSHQDELKSLIRLFVREAQSLSKAGHPNIVGVHQVFEENNTAYMALDYVEGCDLLEILKESPKSLTPDILQEHLLKMLDAIAHVHGRGILHRDISPDNIIVRNDGEPVLIDFGAARETQDEKASRLLSALRVVKDGYSPQEFYIAGSDQGPSCDLYSLAASFYHLITGELPPDSQSRLSAYAAGDADPYVPLAKRTGDYSSAFCSALDKAMSILPKERMQSADEWKALLVGTAPLTSTHNAPRSESQKSSLMPLLFAGTAFAAVVGAGALFFAPELLPGTDEVQTALAEPEAAPSAGILTSAEPAIANPIESPGVVDDTETADGSLREPVGGTSSTDLARAPESLSDPLRSETAPATPNSEIDEPAFMTAIRETPQQTVAAAPTTPGPVEDAPQQLIAIAPAEASPEASASERRETAVRLGPVEAASVMEATVASVPFVLDEDIPGTIASVEGDVPSWLTPGVRIVSVNGEAIDTNDAILAQIDAAVANSSGETTVLVGVDPRLGDAVIEQPLTIRMETQTALLNGLFFVTSLEDGAPVTRVAVVPEGSGFRVGDKLIAYMETGEKISSDTTVKSILDRELANGRTSFSFAVERQGEMWVEAFVLAALGQ